MNKEYLMRIIKAPHVSEKSTWVADNFRQYVFKVVGEATKPEIKKAIELLFNVKVEAVQTSNTQAKLKRTGRIMGKRRGWKKAYVKLVTGHKIDFSGLAA
ncbi:MAG: 50S ribosomal protein L23 [Gammaproteobacteria bacterium]